MKILLFSDIHGDLARLKKLMETEADHYIAVGDMVTWRKGLDAVGHILAAKKDQVWILPGNHESESDIATLCERHGLKPFHGKTFEAAGYTVAGLGYSNPTPFHTPGEYSESEIATRLEPFAGTKPMILVCHCPPKDTALDRAAENQHFGSTSIRHFIEREQPQWFFCGHIHEAEGQKVKLGETTGVNVGKRGYLLEL
ncbi:MAG: metallophosphoesterase [Bryobacterales bacterium]|nr:metallophosphoesterase [Bryobacterales bacterium]